MRLTTSLALCGALLPGLAQAALASYTTVLTSPGIGQYNRVNLSPGFAGSDGRLKAIIVTTTASAWFNGSYSGYADWYDELYADYYIRYELRYSEDGRQSNESVLDWDVFSEIVTAEPEDCVENQGGYGFDCHVQMDQQWSAGTRHVLLPGDYPEFSWASPIVMDYEWDDQGNIGFDGHLTARVDYEFGSVPLPGTLPLLGAGLLGFGLLRRKGRRRFP